MNDKQLEKEILDDLRKLEIKIDAVAPTHLRHFLSESIVNMRLRIRDKTTEGNKN